MEGELQYVTEFVTSNLNVLGRWRTPLSAATVISGK